MRSEFLVHIKKMKELKKAQELLDQRKSVHVPGRWFMIVQDKKGRLRSIPAKDVKLY